MKTTFEMNEIIYKTDSCTLNVLKSIIPNAKKTGDSSAVIAVIELGMITGKIIKIK